MTSPPLTATNCTSLPNGNKHPFSALTRSFLSRTVTASTLGHREHVQVAYELLSAHNFVDATKVYVTEIRALATRAGAPEKFHMTVTVAYLSIIAERMSASAHADFNDFLATNSDLLSSNLLQGWYSKARMSSPVAKEQFLLPDRVAND